VICGLMLSTYNKNRGGKEKIITDKVEKNISLP
jgi:hypothetical protein